MGKMKESEVPSKDDIEQKVERLIAWFDSEGFPERRDDVVLRRFLVGCKYREEVAKKKLTKFYELRRNCPEWFGERDVEEEKMQELFTTGNLLPLPERDEHGRTSILVRTLRLGPRTHPLELVYRAAFFCLDLAIDQDANIVEKGVNVVVDMEGISFGYVFQATPKIILKTVQMWQDIYPVKFKSLHIINCPGFVDFIISLAKGFMRGKLRSRVNNHGRDMDHFYEKFERRLLPRDYGGEAESLDKLTAEWKRKLSDNRQRFLDGEL